MLFLCGTGALYWAALAIGRHHRVAAAYECIENLRRIDSAKYQWARSTLNENNSPAFRISLPEFYRLLATNPLGRVALKTEDIEGYLGGNQRMPRCPLGGTYTLGRITDAPTCSIPGHDIELGPIGITVAEDGGRQISGATVLATDQSGKQWSARTEQDGSAALWTWPNKIVSVSISKDGYITFTNTWPLPPGTAPGGAISLKRKR